MSDIAIRCEGLSKRYRIGRRERYTTLRDTIADSARAPLRRFRSALGHRASQSPDKDNLIWALRDICFDVKRGEVLGIIGRNGAGKSTLLKILSRITSPTEGFADIRGRVCSLLEVGTGFHPELTGRENIYLNGSILGMKRLEIERKFDEIVTFAEIEAFIDTPVKRYSSGMYLRLAFAVAAHLEPEILVVDEVLAVGDVAFQKKCLEKMYDVAKLGRTVLIVSHNLGMVQNLCNRAILLRDGALVADDTTAATVTTYLTSVEKTTSQNLLERVERRGEGKTRIAKIEIFREENYLSTALVTGSPARFLFYVTAARSGMTCSFTIYDQHGQPVTYFDSAVWSPEDTTSSGKSVQFLCEIDEILLIPGRYRINAAITYQGELQDHIEAAAFLDVEQGKLRGRLVPTDSGYGSVFMPHRWITPLQG